MASSAFPSVIDAVTTQATTAVAPVRVVRGQDFSNAPGDVVLIGVRDAREIEDANWCQAGTFRQEFLAYGGPRKEMGTVNGLILAKRGSTDMTAANDACFSILADIEAVVRADKTLGLTAFGDLTAQVSAGAVSESQSVDGATCSLGFSIDYLAFL